MSFNAPLRFRESSISYTGRSRLSSTKSAARCCCCWRCLAAVRNGMVARSCFLLCCSKPSQLCLFTPHFREVRFELQLDTVPSIADRTPDSNHDFSNLNHSNHFECLCWLAMAQAAGVLPPLEVRIVITIIMATCSIPPCFGDLVLMVELCRL